MTWTTRQRSEFGGLAVIAAGKGPRLLLIHGVGLRAEAWNAQIEELSENFEIIAPDLPGHGDSSLLSSPAKLADYSDSLARLLDRPTVVAGHSLGALIALDLASRHSNRVQGVAALNAIFRRSEEAWQAVKERAAGLNGVSIADPSATLTRWFGGEPSPARDACKAWLLSVNPQGYQTAYRVFAEEDGPADEALRCLNCPALFLTGELEPNSTPSMSRAMAELAPMGQVQVIDGAAHMMPMTHAREVNTALRRFVEGCQT
ncbi:MAG: alpha/beta fold hydrolase [Roseibium sp.]|uniref:alpha/beta fold hydrolase n=1 Tax=Roseibium sp. TaxID=1936156 RepID=UPI00262CEEBE|nr:alpha/beta fold hydrolase [Roseibium sp.]MCV0427177.1 alpha/beta fold hydrolase [Roseibium sp.]